MSPNIGLLKLELIARGIRAGGGLPSPLSNPFGLVHLVLPEKVAVSVHLMKHGDGTPFLLVRDKSQFYLERDGQDRVPVSWTPPLKSYGQKTSSGVLVSDILTVHGGFIAVHPRGPCRFGASGLSCRYCGASKGLASPPPPAKPVEPPPHRPSGPGLFKDPSNHPPFSKRDLIEALKIVLKEKRCDFVHLSSGHVETEDGGVDWLGSWITEIRKHVNIMISLDLVPPKSNHWIDQTYAIGADAVYYDLDVFNPEQSGLRKFQIQRERHLEALSHAARIFPSGAVLSHLVVGLEPLEETKKGIDLLVDRGVIPLLVYFPPYPESPLASRWSVRPDEIVPLYAHLFERIVRAGMTPHWVQQADVILTPLEGRYFSKQSARYHIALKKFYQTGFGRKMRLALTATRRRLRVRPA